MTSGGLHSWAPLYLIEGLFLVAVVLLAVYGRTRHPDQPLRWIPDGLERLTGIPGWAAAMVATSWYGLLVAGIGFYDDVAWHIGLGRDKNLFTPPHTMIVIGLATIALAAAVGIVFATVTEADTKLRAGRWRVPWSSLPLGLLGVTALSGFPLDDLWHAHYGIDVTMWSPTHLLMIVGASLSPIAGWLALSEAGVRPSDSAWARGVHVAVAWLVLAGLSSVQGEFDFGVPQFQQLYVPVLIALAAGFALVAARIVLGPGWVLLVGGLSFLARVGDRGSGGLGVTTRSASLYIGSAVIVELVALLVGTRQRLRFALASGVAIGTAGLATEWAWNRHAHQPWTTNLLPDAVIVGVIAALGAAVLGVALAGAVTRRPGSVPVPVLALAGVAVVVSLVVPLPRRVGHVVADVNLDRAGNQAIVDARLTPANAADHARWFQVSAWQGGGLVLSNMKEVGPGHWRSDKAVPVTGRWKTLLRLHRGAEMMTVPLWMPADPQIGKGVISATDRHASFERESKYLLRETRGGNPLFARMVFALLACIVAAWVAAFCLAASKVGRDEFAAPRGEPLSVG